MKACTIILSSETKVSKIENFIFTLIPYLKSWQDEAGTKNGVSCGSIRKENDTITILSPSVGTDIFNFFI